MYRPVGRGDEITKATNKSQILDKYRASIFKLN